MNYEAYWKLLYDNDCFLCCRFVKTIKKFKCKEINYVDLQTYYKYNKQIPLQELLNTIHLVGKKGEVLKDLQAINKLNEILPQSKLFNFLLNSNLGKNTTKVAYKIAKKIRNKKNCKQCKKR